MKSWSSTQATIALSSAEAELYAMVAASAEALGVQGYAKDLGVEMGVELITPIALEPGMRFAIREGGRTVGAGAITSVEE